MNPLIEKAKKIKCLVCDVDGVLTDGKVQLDHEGRESKTFYVPDGMGLKLLMAAGIEVAVITGSLNGSIDQRMKRLGISHYYAGQLDKRNAFLQLKNTLGFSDEEFAYIGDDLPDLPIIKQVGLGVTVPNAIHQVKESAAWETEQGGGQGAVRAVCELILEAQGKQELALTRYYNNE